MRLQTPILFIEEREPGASAVGPGTRWPIVVNDPVLPVETAAGYPTLDLFAALSVRVIRWKLTISGSYHVTFTNACDTLILDTTINDNILSSNGEDAAVDTLVHSVHPSWGTGNDGYITDPDGPGEGVFANRSHEEQASALAAAVLDERINQTIEGHVPEDDIDDVTLDLNGTPTITPLADLHGAAAWTDNPILTPDGILYLPLWTWLRIDFGVTPFGGQDIMLFTDRFTDYGEFGTSAAEASRDETAGNFEIRIPNWRDGGTTSISVPLHFRSMLDRGYSASGETCDIGIVMEPVTCAPWGMPDSGNQPGYTTQNRIWNDNGTANANPLSAPVE